MNIAISAFDRSYRQAAFATHPLIRLLARLPLSFVVAGNGLLPSRFAASTRSDAPSGASNYGF